MTLVVQWDVKQQHTINKIDNLSLKRNLGFLQQVTYVIVIPKG